MGGFIAAWALWALTCLSAVALAVVTLVWSLDASAFVWSEAQWWWAGATLAGAICAVVLAASGFARFTRDF